MRFALINGIPMEAAPGLKARCPGCLQAVIAKCGTQKIHHWAHQGVKFCDDWWEPETIWHRSWKSNYPPDQQEVFLRDEKTGELHIADVRTEGNLVIEFQYSHIKPAERSAREQFYKNMVWVVNGRRLKRDYARFIKGREAFRKTDKPGIFISEFPDECFPAAWLKSKVPVLFDFKDHDQPDAKSDGKLYCLFPNPSPLDSLVAEIPRAAFIKYTLNGEWTHRLQNYLQERAQRQRMQQQQQNIRLGRRYFSTFLSYSVPKRRRRF